MSIVGHNEREIRRASNGRVAEIQSVDAVVGFGSLMRKDSLCRHAQGAIAVIHGAQLRPIVLVVFHDKGVATVPTAINVAIAIISSSKKRAR
jgi:hypothetical protein